MFQVELFMISQSNSSPRQWLNTLELEKNNLKFVTLLKPIKSVLVTREEMG